MDEVLIRYKQGKFNSCLELIKLLPHTDDTVESLLRENCSLICKSVVSFHEIKILNNVTDEITETQELLYLFFDKVSSLAMISDSIPFQLKLTVSFNYIFWLLFYNDSELCGNEKEECLVIVNKGLLRVLGKNVSPSISSNKSEMIFDNLYYLKSLIPGQDTKTVLLILEFITIVLLYVFKINKNSVKKSVKVVSAVVEDIRNYVSILETESYILKEKPADLCLFKFGLNQVATLVSELSTTDIDHLYLLESVFLFLTNDFKKSLKTLQKNINSNIKNLWNYLGALNCYKLENWGLCLKFLTGMNVFVISSNLKTKYYTLQGKIHSIKRNHKEALRHFEKALSFSPKNPCIYYYIGQEYGRIGLYDMMHQNFEKLVEVIMNKEVKQRLTPNFETTLLDIIHSPHKMTETEAIYAMTVSLGLNEKFQKASEMYEKILHLSDIDKINVSREYIQIPNFLTILHEASIMNLLSGNLVRAEQLALDAAESFIPQEPSYRKQKNLLLTRDVGWLQHIIHYELLESDLEPKELQAETMYSEDALFSFPENIIALLIVSEIQRIQEVDEYKATLSKILLILSKYLSSMCTKEVVSEEEKLVWTLAKALAGKICLRVANLLMNHESEEHIEKMLKRALSCNKGDKDALYYYYKFLINVGRKKEALKLWHTFYKEEAAVTVDNVQSFALRYFLLNKITKREIQTIHAETQFLKVSRI